jgi:hypothetical protein
MVAGSRMQLAPFLQNVKRPGTGPGNRSTEEASPDPLDFSPAQQPTEWALIDSFCGQNPFDLRSKILLHPVLEGQREAPLSAMHNLIRERSIEQPNQQFLRRPIHLPLARKRQYGLSQPVINERDSQLEPMSHAHKIGIAQQGI